MRVLNAARAPKCRGVQQRATLSPVPTVPSVHAVQVYHADGTACVLVDSLLQGQFPGFPILLPTPSTLSPLVLPLRCFRIAAVGLSHRVASVAWWLALGTVPPNIMQPLRRSGI